MKKSWNAPMLETLDIQETACWPVYPWFPQKPQKPSFPPFWPPCPPYPPCGGDKEEDTEKDPTESLS